MSEKNLPEVFVDGIGSIVFMGGVIRAELGSYTSTVKDANGNPTYEAKQQIIISPQGFLQVTNSFNALLKRLNEAGVMKTTAEPTIATSSEKGDKSGDKKKG